MAALAMIGAAGATSGQPPAKTVEEPRWLKLDLEEVSAGIYSEGTFESYRYKNSGTEVSHDRLFLGPLLGLKLNGSIYHPNLVNFRIDSEGSYGWGQEETRSSTTLHRDEMQYLGNLQANLTILRNQPYRTTVFGDYQHSYRDYDFFNRVTVDTWRYGARSGYTEGPVPVSVSYTHRDEEVTGFTSPSTSREDFVGVDARNERASGGTTFNYNLNRYSRSDFGRSGEGTDHTVSLSDTERLGAEKQHTLTTRAAFLRRENIEDPSDQITSGADFQAQHHERVTGRYTLNYDRYVTDTFDSDSLAGRADLQHRLYDSLTSTLIVQASDFESSDQISSGYHRRFGGGFAENYTKRLGSRGRLQIGNTLLVDHVEQKTLSTVQNERHSFTGGGAPVDSFFLNLANVMEATIVVTTLDSSGSELFPPWVNGVDYTVVRNGTRTLIQRAIGSRIPRDATVLVDYEAEPTPDGTYETFSDSFHVRLDLWDNLWGLYGRINYFAHNAADELRIQSLTAFTFGTDFSWRWLHAGAEYQIYDATQSSFRSARLFQSLNFQLDQASTLSFSFTETWTEFLDIRRREEDYRFISRLRHWVSHRFSADLEGGIALRRGSSDDPTVNVNVDQTVATVRPSFEWVIGRTTIKAGYEYRYELFLENEERSKHMFFLRARRVF